MSFLPWTIYCAVYSEEDLIKHYFNRSPRLKYREICFIMTEHHKIPLKLARLKSFLVRNGLNRKSTIDDGLLDRIVRNEVSTSNSLIGYREMKHIISRKYHTNVSYERVRKSILRIDPEGVFLRSKNVIRRRIYRASGPFHILHIDGHDKLKRFGFAIHGGIDGFSRRIVWLKVSTTNNDPLVVANYFLQFLERYKRAPNILRFDRGTENIYCQDMQVFSTNREFSYIYGSSVRNQRIEALWSRLVRYKIKWWIDFFHAMGMDRIYNAELPLHREFLLFCFTSVLQYELNEFLEIWNTRYVRKSAEAPGGRPDILFNFPQTEGYDRKGVPISELDLMVMSHALSIDQTPTTRDPEIQEMLSLHCDLNNLDYPPRSADDGRQLFDDLVRTLAAEGFNV